MTAYGIPRAVGGSFAGKTENITQVTYGPRGSFDIATPSTGTLDVRTPWTGFWDVLTPDTGEFDL